MADSERFIEFGFGESLMIRVEAIGQGRLQATVLQTLNADDQPTVRLQIVEDAEEPSAALVKRRLHGLRQVYAIMYFLNDDGEEQLASALQDDADLDIEQHFLTEEAPAPSGCRPGQLVGTLIKNVASRTTLNLLSLLYGEGRSLLLKRARAGTNALKEDVRSKAIANDEAYPLAAIEIGRKLGRIKDVETRKQVEHGFVSQCRGRK